MCGRVEGGWERRAAVSGVRESLFRRHAGAAEWLDVHSSYTVQVVAETDT